MHGLSNSQIECVGVRSNVIFFPVFCQTMSTDPEATDTGPASRIKEIPAETFNPTKYNIAMTILQQAGTEGEGMVLRYQDYEDEMSRLQFSDFAKDVSNVSKMLSILNVYRPELMDKINAAIEEPAEVTVSNGPQPAADVSSAAGVTSQSSGGRS